MKRLIAVQRARPAKDLYYVLPPGNPRPRDRQFVILRTIGHHTDKGGTCPVCELLDWTGEQLPSSFESFDIRKSNRLGPKPITQFMIGRTGAKERPDDRLQVLGVRMKPAQKSSGYSVFLWRWFDKALKEHFGLE